MEESIKLITFDEFVNMFDPILNKEEGPYGGFLFETYGEDLALVKKYNEDCCWTLVDCDNEESYIIPGFHFVNRVGYFITNIPYKNETEIY